MPAPAGVQRHVAHRPSPGRTGPGWRPAPAAPRAGVRRRTSGWMPRPPALGLLAPLPFHIPGSSPSSEPFTNACCSTATRGAPSPPTRRGRALPAHCRRNPWSTSPIRSLSSVIRPWHCPPRPIAPPSPSPGRDASGSAARVARLAGGTRGGSLRRRPVAPLRHGVVHDVAQRPHIGARASRRRWRMTRGNCRRPRKLLAPSALSGLRLALGLLQMAAARFLAASRSAAVSFAADCRSAGHRCRRAAGRCRLADVDQLTSSNVWNVLPGCISRAVTYSG